MTRFETLYRVSLYVLLFLSALILNMDADVDYAKFYPIGMALAGVLAYWSVDRNPRLGLSVGLANLMALGSFALVFLEISIDPNQLVLACGHWLFYLCLVKMFRPKSAEDDWYLIILGLMQVLVGCFLSQSDRVGLALLAWSLLALWVLGLFFLHREAKKQAQPSGKEPYPNLLTIPFFFSAVRAAATTLLLGGLIFLAMPRSALTTQNQGGPSGATHLSGFSDEVQLGQLGEILENDAVVMSVELFNAEGRRVAPQDELLWRGVVLSEYKEETWSRGRQSVQLNPLPTNSRSDSQGSGTLIQQNIRLEDIGNIQAAFALRPILEVEVQPEDALLLNSTDGTLIRDRSQLQPRMSRGNRVFRRGGTLDYKVLSLLTLDTHTQPGETRFTRRSSRRDILLTLPENLREPLLEISEPLMEALDEEDTIGRARALEAYLRDSGQFQYSYRMSRVDRQIDANLDFLINRKEGHCEYFASALAMLLRSQGIPSRLVNGFKGGDWNDFSRSLTVRQRHSHSWVEALIGVEDNGNPIWLTLDPTPADERDELVAQASGLPPILRQFTDFVRYLWIFYIAGFNAERQEKLLYEPIRDLWEAAQNGFAVMGDQLKRAFQWLTDFPSPAAFFSVKGFFVSFFVMLVSVGAFFIVQRLWSLLVPRLRGPSDDNADSTGMFTIYARLARVLAEYGFERPPAETPQEFARRAAELLRHRDDNGSELAEIPKLVVSAFYQARFGGLALGQDVLDQLEQRIDTLEFRLRPVD